MARYIGLGTNTAEVVVLDKLQGDTRVINLRNSVRELRDLEEVALSVSCVKFNRTASHLFVTIGQGILCLRCNNLQDYEWLSRPNNFFERDPITSMSVDFGVRRLFACDNNSIKLWRVQHDHMTLLGGLGGEDAGNRMCIDYSGQVLMSGRRNGAVERWNNPLNQGQAPTATLDVEPGVSVNSIALSNWICATTASGNIYELTYNGEQGLVSPHHRNFFDRTPVGCFFPRTLRWLGGVPDANGLVPVVLIYGERIAAYNPQTHQILFSTRVRNTRGLNARVCSYTHLYREVYCGTLNGRLVSFELFNDRVGRLEDIQIRNGNTAITALDCWTGDLEPQE